MRITRLILTCILLIALALASMPAMAKNGDLGREVLPPNDGWAAFGSGAGPFNW
jgi:hypothetical protein